MRKEIVLAESWVFFQDCDNLQALNASTGHEVGLPHTWNAIDGQDGGNDYFRGTCCYVKTFERPEYQAGQQVWLEFGAVNASARVYLNGTEVASHDGGYSSFRAHITPYLADSNTLHVFADNSANDSVYPQTADFTFYGGIYRDVKLIILSENHFEFGRWGGKGIRLTPRVLENGKGLLDVQAKVTGRYDEVVISLFDGVNCIAKASGCECILEVEQVHLWEGLKDPFLYLCTAELLLDGEPIDCLEYTIGFKTVLFDAEKGCFLNGRSYPLRGVSRHQDRLHVGNALTPSMHEEDMAIILECGANSVRLAHYQHDQTFYDLCDQRGVVCWAEIPYITKHMPNGVDNTMSQMQELIEQCHHHPSIVCWGISNEITAGGNSQEVYANNLALYEKCHELDGQRPVAMAHAFMLPVTDKLVTLPDIIGYNLYYGWYMGTMQGNGQFLDTCHQAHPDIPLALTEFGCEANLQFQTCHPKKGDYSEQYQAEFHEFMCSEINRRPYLWGTFVWNMFDFAADARDEGGTKGKNCKGLVTFDRKTRKDSFYAIKSWYSDEPFVHICGRRYVNRSEEITEVKVYSNQHAVELFCNGVSQGKQEGSHAFIFKVRLNRHNIIEAKSGNLCDRIEVNKVASPDPGYRYGASEAVANWFSGLQLEFPEGRLSINDTVGEMIRVPEGRKILDEVLAKRSSEKEGIAAQIKMDEYMITVTMKDVQFSEMLRRAKLDDSYVMELNRRLNRLEKLRH